MSVIACSIIYPLSHGGGDLLRGLPSNEIQNLTSHDPNRFRWVGNLSFGEFPKRIFCGFIVCLMALLINLSLFRYKADLYFERGRKLLYKNELAGAIQSYEMAVMHNPLELYYRNVLNRIYLKMAVISIDKSQGSITEERANIFSREQTTMWLKSAIAGAERKCRNVIPETTIQLLHLARLITFLINCQEKIRVRML